MSEFRVQITTQRLISVDGKLRAPDLKIYKMKKKKKKRGSRSAMCQKC